MKQAHVFVSGFVQGVGFRHFVRSKAVELGITGWITNLPDNRVEALFQGEKGSIDTLIKLCKRGPFLSEVEEVDAKWDEIEEKYNSFVIL